MKKNPYMNIVQNASLDELATLSKQIHQSHTDIYDNQKQFELLSDALHAEYKNTTETHNLAYALQFGTKNLEALHQAQEEWLVEPQVFIQDEEDPSKKRNRIVVYDVIHNQNTFKRQIPESNMMAAQEILDDHDIPFRQLYAYATNNREPSKNIPLIQSMSNSPDEQHAKIIAENPYNEFGDLYEEKTMDTTYEMDIDVLKRTQKLAPYTARDMSKKITHFHELSQKAIDVKAKYAPMLLESDPNMTIKPNFTYDTFEQMQYVRNKAMANTSDDAKYLIYIGTNQEKTRMQYNVMPITVSEINGKQIATMHNKQHTQLELPTSQDEAVAKRLFTVKNPTNAIDLIQAQNDLDAYGLYNKTGGDITKLKDEVSTSNVQNTKLPGLQNYKTLVDKIDDTVVESIKSKQKNVSNTVKKTIDTLER